MTDAANAADMPADGADAAEGGKKKLSKKMLIIAGGGLVLVLALLAGAYFMFFSGGGASESESTEVAAPPAFFYDLPTMTVNLANVGNGEQFLKLQVSLELSDEAMVKEIEPKMTRVLDAFQVYLRELRRSDLEGSAGIYRLKEELRRRVNLAVYPAEVNSILFREILVQ